METVYLFQCIWSNHEDLVMAQIPESDIMKNKYNVHV